MAAPELALIQDMAVVAFVAAATMLLFQRARLSAVLGYILAGVIIGPYTPPFSYLHDIETVNLLGQFGLVFLLFAVGLEFNLGRLRQVGGSTVLAAVLQAALILALGYVLGRSWGFDHIESLFLGAIISVSSTAIIVTVLTETGQRDAAWARVVMGITLIEDVVAVILLTMLSAAGGAEGAGVGDMLLRLGLFLAAALVVGPRLIPRAVDRVARRSPEALLLVAVALAFGMALLSASLGFSVALGAFVVGALVGESLNARLVANRIASLRDLFTAVFFVTVGMLFDPRLLLAHWPLILSVAAALLLAKVVFAGAATFLTGRSAPESIHVGMALVPLGEFSFVLAAVAAGLGLDAPLYAVAVGVAAITALAAPIFIRAAPRVARLYEERAPVPVRTYASLYRAWLGRARGLAAQDPRRRLATRLGLKVVLYGGAAAAVLAAGGSLVHGLGSVAVGATGAQGAPVALAGWGVVAAAAAPLLLLWWRTLHAFVGALAAATMSRTGEAAGTGALVLERTFLLVGVVTFGMILVATASPFLPSGALLAAVVLVAGAVVLLLFRALRRLQVRVDREVDRALSGGAPSALGERLREVYPWEVDVREVVVPPAATSAHRSLRDLHVRNRTGATVLAIRRAGHETLNPSPDATLLPGDHVALAGEPEQLERAAALLTSVQTADPVGVAADETRSREIPLPDASPLAGVSLAGARLRERTGATIAAVRRGEDIVRNPAPSYRLKAGDVVVAVGSAEQLARLEALMAAA